MNKAEVIEQVVKGVGLSKKAAKEAVDAMLSTIARTVSEGEMVRLTGFGTFEARPRKSTIRRNPRNQREKISVPPRAVPGFRPGRALRELVSKKLKVIESPNKELTIIKAVR